MHNNSEIHGVKKLYLKLIGLTENVYFCKKILFLGKRLVLNRTVSKRLHIDKDEKIDLETRV